MVASTLEDAERRKAWGFVAPALLWTLAFFVAPFLFMAAMSLWAQQAGEIVKVWNFSNYIAFFQKDALFQALINSLEITATVTVLSVLLAYPLAWIIAERVPQRCQRTALIMAVLPFWTSYVVRSYAWLLVLSKGGVINQALISARPDLRAAGARQQPHGHRHRLRAFLRHADDADDLRQPGADRRRTTARRPPISAPTPGRASGMSCCR